MFSQVCGGGVWQGGMHGRGACMAGGHVWQGEWGCVAADGMHPTGMRSCSFNFQRHFNHTNALHIFLKWGSSGSSAASI